MIACMGVKLHCTYDPYEVYISHWLHLALKV